MVDARGIALHESFHASKSTTDLTDWINDFDNSSDDVKTDLLSRLDLDDICIAHYYANRQVDMKKLQSTYELEANKNSSDIQKAWFRGWNEACAFLASEYNV